MQPRIAAGAAPSNHARARITRSRTLAATAPSQQPQPHHLAAPALAIDWDAPAGRSPFVTGLQRSGELAQDVIFAEQRAEAAAAIAAGQVSPAWMAKLVAAQTAKLAAAFSLSMESIPKLLWCELCRVHCESEQEHHNTQAHQARCDAPEQQQPLKDELDRQRMWNIRLHFMAKHIRIARGKPLPEDLEPAVTLGAACLEGHASAAAAGDGEQKQ